MFLTIHGVNMSDTDLKEKTDVKSKVEIDIKNIKGDGDKSAEIFSLTNDMMEDMKSMKPTQKQSSSLSSRKIESLVNKSQTIGSTSSVGATMYIGAGTEISTGTITAENLVVAGKITEVVTINVKTLEVVDGGELVNVKEITAESAVICGRCVGGNLKVTGNLKIGSTGKINGNLSYGDLSIEQGGMLSGNIMCADTTE